MKKITFLFILPCFLIYKNVQNNPALTFFLRPYPSQEFINKLKKPKNLAYFHIVKMMNHNNATGIFSTYAGYINASGPDGQTTYPRSGLAKPSIPLIITNKIVPIIMFGNTIDHWQREPTTPAAFYMIEQKKDETGLVYWDVQGRELPANNSIPREALIIIAKPKNVYVPEGITLTQENPNLILPDLYVKKGINIINNALYILNFAQFFSPIHLLCKQEPMRVISQTVD